MSERMPALRPIPIPTKDRFFLVAIFIWIFSIRKWVLLDDWRYTVRDGAKIFIPKDFVFDGASIPRLFWLILSPTGLLLLPGLIHDYAYKFDMLWQVSESGEFSKYKSKAGKGYWDKIFWHTAIDVNGFKIINTLAWLALVIGGWFAWWGHRRRNQTPEKPIAHK